MTETTLHFACDHCGKRYSCPGVHAGRRTKCGKCGEAIAIPQESTRADPLAELVGFACELCGTRINVPPRYVGRQVKCPDCDHATTVPQPEAKRPRPRPAAMEGEQYEVYEGEEQPRGIDLAAASPASIGFECRVCQTHLAAPASAIGTLVACPDCRTETPVPAPKIKPKRQSLVGDDYEIDEAAETLNENAGLYDEYLSKPPLGYKTYVKDDDSRRQRRADGIEETIEAPRWGLGLLSGFASCFANSTMLIALLGLSFAAMFSLPLLEKTVDLFGLGLLNSFIIGSIVALFSFAVTLICVGVGSAIYWATLSDSAAGSKRVEQWPSIDPGEWIGPALCLIFGNVVAAIPGSLLAGVASQSFPQLAPLVGITGVWLVLPWIQLAQLDNNSPWGVLSTRIARTSYHAPVTWIFFYLITLGLGLLSFELIDSAITHLGRWAVLVISPVITIETIVYAWLVGRVGWAAGAATPEIETPLT